MPVKLPYYDFLWYMELNKNIEKNKQKNKKQNQKMKKGIHITLNKAIHRQMKKKKYIESF